LTETLRIVKPIGYKISACDVNLLCRPILPPQADKDGRGPPVEVERVNDLLRLFRWQDGLDILILTFVFYRLYLWLKKKRALRMILVILALPLYYIIARWIDLPLSVWGLQNLWPVILLVLVVIFQQEIREVLGSITLPTFLFGRPEMEQTGPKALDKIAKAAFQMIDRQIGGLIVLQRKDDLDEFIHGKTDLDAEINEDLLISIFTPQSPLHDGAAIIRGDRICYATALLPVSRSPLLPKEWGARHHAGLGITEVSDAECIIISEERKEVLLASGGKAAKMKTQEDLKESLSGLFLPSPDIGKRKRWPRNMLNDLPTKVLSLLLVCLLWVFVIGLRQGEITFNVPIEYYSIPSNLAMTGSSPKIIHVRLRGSQRLLSSMDPDRLRMQIDLRDTRAGTNQISLSQNAINVPSGVSAVEFNPRKITIQLSPSPGLRDRP